MDEIKIARREQLEKSPAEYNVGFVCTVLKNMIRGHLRKLRQDPEDYNIDAIVNPTEVRNGIIRGKYRACRQAAAEMNGSGETVRETMELLGKQFGLCVEMIKHIVANRR